MLTLLKKSEKSTLLKKATFLIKPTILLDPGLAALYKGAAWPQSGGEEKRREELLKSSARKSSAQSYVESYLKLYNLSLIKLHAKLLNSSLVLT